MIKTHKLPLSVKWTNSESVSISSISELGLGSPQGRCDVLQQDTLTGSPEATTGKNPKGLKVPRHRENEHRASGTCCWGGEGQEWWRTEDTSPSGEDFCQVFFYVKYNLLSNWLPYNTKRSSQQVPSSLRFCSYCVYSVSNVDHTPLLWSSKSVVQSCSTQWKSSGIWGPWRKEKCPACPMWSQWGLEWWIPN